MVKLKSVLAAFSMCLFWQTGLWAQGYVEDGFEFSINDERTEITITKYVGTQENVTVPSSIRGIKVVAIGKRAFRDLDYYGASRSPKKSVIISEGIKSIGEEAFYDRGILSVSLPKGISIGRRAFCGCRNLTSVSIQPDTVLEENAFSSCSKLKDVSIAENVHIGERAFADCDGIEGINIPSGATLSKGAFERCDKLSQVTVAEGVSVIPEGCFSGCEALSQVSLPHSLRAIKAKAFYGCPISRVEIPEGVWYVGERAFSSREIRFVSLPKSLRWLEGGKRIIGDNSIEDAAIAAGCSPRVLCGGDVSRIAPEHGLDEFIPFDADRLTSANKDVYQRLQDFKVEAVITAFQDNVTDVGISLFADLLKMGFTEDEAVGIVSRYKGF